MFWATALAVVCYLIGSIPFPLLVSRWVRGIDLRQHGSGNMGATNAARVLGKRWFPVVFGLDFAKGAAATYLAKALLPELSGLDLALAAAIGGAAAVIGHCFPIYVGFTGGVGLAASAGALALVSPGLMLTATAGLGLLWALSGNMYVGTAGAALLYPLMGYFWVDSLSVALVLTVWGLVVFALHRKDVARWLQSRRTGDPT